MDTPCIALLLTGNELMSGDTVDSNSAMIAIRLGDHGLEIGEIDEIARVLVNGAFDRHINHIIVAMPIRMGAFAEHFKVLGFVPIVVPEFVRSIESRTAGDGYLFHCNEKQR